MRPDRRFCICVFAWCMWKHTIALVGNPDPKRYEWVYSCAQIHDR